MSITREQFQLQVDRLCDTFGDRHFPDQRTHMAWGYVRDLEYPSVIRIVDQFIRESKYAPLPVDFLDAAKAEQRNTLMRDVREAVDPSNWDNGLKAVLDRDYPGAKTLTQAVEIERLRLQIAKAKGEA